MKVFIDDNVSYQKWIEKHPNSYVINTKPQPSHSYRVAHLSSCEYITHRTKSTKNYIKICGNNPQEIAKWFTDKKLNFDGQFHECGQCNPDINRKIKDV